MTRVRRTRQRRGGGWFDGLQSWFNKKTSPLATPPLLPPTTTSTSTSTAVAASPSLPLAPTSIATPAPPSTTTTPSSDISSAQQPFAGGRRTKRRPMRPVKKSRKVRRKVRKVRRTQARRRGGSGTLGLRYYASAVSPPERGAQPHGWIPPPQTGPFPLSFSV